MPSGSSDNNDPQEPCRLRGGANDSVAPDLIIYTAVRTEVMAGDLAGVQKIVEHHLLRTPVEACRFFQSLMFHIQDYDADPRELYHIPECRAWFQGIDRRYPFLIYFLPCVQYTLYVGSQHSMDGASLPVVELWSFFKERDGALQQLAQRIGEPYGMTKEKLLRAFRDYAQIELKPW